MQKNRRLFICGAAGTGKTTLAKAVSERMGIPFVASSASDIWPDFGFKDHADALLKCHNDPVLGWEYQTAILNRRENLLNQHDEFITDRTPFDAFTYFLIENAHNIDSVHLEEFRLRCHHLARMANQVVFLPHGDWIKTEENGKRIANRGFNFMVTGIMRAVLRDDYLNILNHPEHKYTVMGINYWDLEKRIKHVQYFIEQPSVMDSKWTL